MKGGDEEKESNIVHLDKEN